MREPEFKDGRVVNVERIQWRSCRHLTKHEACETFCVNDFTHYLLMLRDMVVEIFSELGQISSAQSTPMAPGFDGARNLRRRAGNPMDRDHVPIPCHAAAKNDRADIFVAWREPTGTAAFTRWILLTRPITVDTSSDLDKA